MDDKQYVMDSLSVNESWRVFRIMAEIVEGIETLSNVHNAVTIFGSARVKPEDEYYQQTERLAGLLVKEGFSVITGGGPGIMEAANRGAKEAGGLSLGSNIILPHEQAANEYMDRFMDFDHFFVRKVMLVKYSCAFVVLPGGFGTLDEVFETVTLMQTDKILDFPVIAMGSRYWTPLIDFIRRTLVGEGTISPHDLDLIRVTDSVDQAVDWIARAGCAAAES